VRPVTEPDFQRTRNGYDLTAAMYAERFHTHLDDRPLDRAMLTGFAGLVDRQRVVADVGCGTGATSRMLADFGLDVLGIDLSPNMITEAQRRNPDLSFQVGSMTDFDLADGCLDGICAWYSVIHVPDELLHDVFLNSVVCFVLAGGRYWHSRWVTTHSRSTRCSASEWR
jgi:SAM-dependent methyltransferase